MAETQKIEMHTRVLEIAVNRLLRVLEHELSLNQIEATFVLAKALEHMETRVGVKIDRALLVPDQANSKSHP